MATLKPYLLHISIELKSASDRKRFRSALTEIAKEDSHFCTFTGSSGQVILQGNSEGKLDSIIGRAMRKSGTIPNVGSAQVAYRETITRICEIDYTHRLKPPEPGSDMRVILFLEPLPSGSGFEFKSRVIGVKVTQECLDNIESGIEGALLDGVICGLPVVDVRATLKNVDYHESCKKLHPFATVARIAVKEALIKGEPTLLEPVMAVEVITPKDCADDIINDLKNRRGHIAGKGLRDERTVINSTVPLENLLGYAVSLKSISRSLANYTMSFSHFSPIPTPDGSPPRRPSVVMRG